MKKLVLNLIIILTVTVCKSQTNTYHSFPDSAYWRVDYHVYALVQNPTNVKYYFQYYITGDTLIGTYNYKKIFKSCDSVEVIQWTFPTDTPTSTISHYVGALRDDSLLNKTFFIFPGSYQDSVLFDYNLEVGDTLNGFITQYAFACDLTVTSIDSLLINGQYRKRWNFIPCDGAAIYIIEGIGSSAGLIDQIYSDNIDHTRRYLVCVKDSSSTLFTSEYNSTMGCDLIYADLNEINIANISNCYPNPFSIQTILQTDRILNDATLTVFNSFGQQIKQIKNISGQTFTLQRDNLSSGLYFLQLTQDNKILTTDKIVITDK